MLIQEAVVTAVEAISRSELCHFVEHQVIPILLLKPMHLPYGLRLEVLLLFKQMVRHLVDTNWRTFRHFKNFIRKNYAKYSKVSQSNVICGLGTLLIQA